MKLADFKARAVERELAHRLVRRRRDLPVATVSALVLTVLAGSTLVDPGDWAKGTFFQPGHWGRDTFGYGGAVFFVRAAIALLALLAWVWALRVVRDLTWGRTAQRAEIAAEETVFDPPDRPRHGPS
jgi:hypothetical protein